jgi:RNA polymerase sigma-70 factor (ECF subfamily)
MPRPSATTPTEAALLARARAGDPEAQRALFARHERLLAGRIRRVLPPRVRRRVSVSDVLQETRILVAERIGGFEPRHAGAYQAWLLRIADLKAREALRAHAGTAKRAVRREASDDTGPARSVPDRRPSPSQAAMSRETSARVLRTLARLSPADQEVLRLAQLEDRPLAEVAERMGRSPEATKKLFGRALARFARALEAEDGRA